MYSIDKLPSVIEIGRAGEKNFREVEFDLSAWMVEMPAGVPSLIVNRPGESEDDAYIAGTTFANNILTWTVTDSDTAFVGTGNIQIWLEEEDPETLTTGKRGKSVIVAVRIEESLTSGSTEVPDPQTTWMEQMTELSTNVTNAKTAAETAQGLAEAAQSAAEGAQTAAETAQGLAEDAQDAAEDAQEAAEAAQSGAEAAGEHYPYIDTDTGKWMAWDTDEGAFVSTGVDAQGPQGETGASGQDGTSEYVHIKYAASEPTQDSDMKDTADAWMGVYSGTSSTAPTTYTSYTWYKIKGATGTGVPDGGTAGQYVKKISGSENDTTWESPVTGLTETTAGKILDATQGKVLNDKITTVSGEIAIIVDGNSVNQSLTTGDYIVLMNSTISGVTDGLYKMAADVASNTAIVAANLTAVSGGIGSQVKSLSDKTMYKELSGISSQSALDTALTNWLSNMSTVSKDMLTFSPSASFGYFTSGERYYVEISKSLSSTYSVAIITRNSSTNLIIAGKKTTGWKYDSISDRIGSMKYEFFGQMDGNSTKTITVGPSTRALLFTIGFGGVKGAWIANGTSTSAASIFELASESSISASASGSNIVLTNSATTSPSIMAFVFVGSLTAS